MLLLTKVRDFSSDCCEGWIVLKTLVVGTQFNTVISMFFALDEVLPKYAAADVSLKDSQVIRKIKV